MTKTTDASWFPPCRPEATPPPALDGDAIQLFCLAHAGAGASVYRDWPALLAPGIEAVPVKLPGRESRHREPALDTAAELVGGLEGPRGGPRRRELRPVRAQHGRSALLRTGACAVRARQAS
ncbi:thioesterase domain-containing protein [Streptomyces sp. NPDC046931]|uniref:thioesterase II family protein n=1 Tax=Streptomyces sp. NPDC046931 TaxID=3154806 RepID=UPI0033D92774